MRRLLAFLVRSIFLFGLRSMDWEPWERLSQDSFTFGGFLLYLKEQHAKRRLRSPVQAA